MKVLITSSRMPFALGMVRKLAADGREIYAADDHLLSPGNHSKYVAGHFVYPGAVRPPPGSEPSWEGPYPRSPRPSTRPVDC